MFIFQTFINFVTTHTSNAPYGALAVRTPGPTPCPLAGGRAGFGGGHKKYIKGVYSNAIVHARIGIWPIYGIKVMNKAAVDAPGVIYTSRR